MLNFFYKYFSTKYDSDELGESSPPPTKRRRLSSVEPILLDDFEVSDTFQLQEPSDLCIFSSEDAFNVSVSLDSNPLALCPRIRFPAGQLSFANIQPLVRHNHILEALFDEKSAKRLRFYQEHEPHDEFWLDDDIIFKFCQTLELTHEHFATLEPSLFQRRTAFERFVNKSTPLHRLLATKTLIAFAVEMNHHWYGVLIDKEKSEVLAFDGLNDSESHEQLFSFADQLIQGLHPQAHSFSYTSLRVPTQNNFADCGVVVCLLTQAFAQNRLTPTAQKRLAKQGELDYGPFRSTIAVHLSASQDRKVSSKLKHG